MVRGRREDGYNLVALVVLFTVMSIAAAAALPHWSTAIRREKEEELIFRGLQYAEAIRVFQRRFGRYPVRLAELVEVKPRCIRKLWQDPMTEEGNWRLVYVDAEGEPVVPGNQPPPANDPEGRPLEDDDAEEENGPGEPADAGNRPIVGVYSHSSKTAIKLFFERDRYDQWRFTANLFQGGGPITGVGPGTVQRAPTANANWLGRPFGRGVIPPGTAGDPEPGSLPPPSTSTQR
jgi:type II secretory pathway pseudopilin PulG